MAKNKELKNTDTKASKLKRMCVVLQEKDGEWQSPTRIAHDIGIHHDTIRDFVDEFDTMSEAGIQTLRDKKGKLLKIRSSSSSLEIKRELRDQRKELIGIRDMLDEIKTSLKKNR